jgi:hypothetical protein
MKIVINSNKKYESEFFKTHKRVRILHFAIIFIEIKVLFKRLNIL